MAVGFAALFGWPVLMAILFQKLPVKQAIIWSIVTGYLLLPSGEFVSFDPPLLPPIDKALIPSLFCILLAIYKLNAQKKAAVAAARRGLTTENDGLVLEGWVPRSIIGRVLFLGIFVATAMTFLTNRAPFVDGATFLRGLATADLISHVSDMIILLLPLVIGRKFLADDEGHRRLIWIIGLAALGYSLLTLYEVRMSPQLNLSVYGFFPHSWLQHFRAGGWRPLVFLDHGLLLGIFLAYSVLAAVILARMSKSGAGRMFYTVAALWLLMTLVLAKTLGALIIAILLIPVALMLNVRLQLLVAATVAGITLLYPMLRSSDLVPTEAIIAFAEARSHERAQSLEFRFNNEDVLLEKANVQPLFGWGLNARSRVFDDQGNDIAVTDGIWVVIMGVLGWVGYITIFGLATLPTILLAFRARHFQIGLATSGLCLMLTANLIDLIPNSSLTPIMFLMAGAVLGRLETAKVSVTESETKLAGPSEPEIRGLPLPEPALSSRYTRFAQTHQRERSSRRH